MIDVSVLDDAGSGNVAAVMQPAPSELVLDSMLRAMGLSAREREVAALLAQGRPTKSIAAMLGLSPWTVKDHVMEQQRYRGRPRLVATTRLVGVIGKDAFDAGAGCRCDVSDGR